MSKLTDYQKLRRKCAEKYCPKDWTFGLWICFYDDCLIIVANHAEKDKEWTESLYKAYTVPEELVTNVIAFIKENINALKRNID